METMLESTSILDALRNELREETAITKRALERVPADKLMWRPHQKSMSLGQLALHVATIPGGLAQLLQQDSFDVTQGSFVPAQPKSVDEILAAYEESIRDGEHFLQGLTPEKANASWRLLKKDRELFARPRIEVVRTIMLNHWYHHRGQLSLYLRLLEIPVPVIYGRSADEDPFGAA